jgi:predicted amidophosphoribosyltransferase
MRLKNVEGIFEIKKNYKLPDSIILVDDIWTTGSTLKSACKELKRKGVKKVWAITLAR